MKRERCYLQRRELLSAPRTFTARPPGEVSDYLDTTRLGQTEPGSFVFTVISPLTVSATSLASAGAARAVRKACNHNSVEKFAGCP